MRRESRRHWLKNSLLAGTVAIAGRASVRAEETASDNQEPAKDLSLKEKGAMERIAREFMDKYRAPAFSVAFAKDGKLVARAAYGLADPSTGEEVTPEHRFRIASVSKPITSAAVFALIEAGRLSLEDRVFNPGGILAEEFGLAAGRWEREVTIHHLLTHTAGGWGNQRADPMFEEPTLNQHELIAWTLKHQPLEQAPGVHYAYSNFGYCVLGRVIEKLTGKSYETQVKESILGPSGIRTMEVAGDSRAERKEMEVIYDRAKDGDPYGLPVRRMDSHGGWLATPEDLVRFALHVDGFPTVPDLLKESTIKEMIKPTEANGGYACGWAVNKAGNWWHLGSLPGTTTILVRTSSGFCWAGLTNTRAPGMDAALDQLMWKLKG